MYRFILSILLLSSLSAQAQLFPNLGGQRTGISSLTFLKIEVSPRAAALASSNIALDGDAYSTYTNPATLADVQSFSLAASNTFWAADINYAFLSAALPSKVGNFGVSVSALTSGAMERRTVFQPEGTGEFFYATYATAGLTYSQQLTDQFSYGVTAKYVREQLAEFSANTVVFDLGFVYRTDFKELSFAVMLQSFGFGSTLSGSVNDPDTFNPKDLDLQSYPAPTLFKLGASMVPYRDDTQALLVSLQLNHPNDNAENIRLGLEYDYKSLLFLRAGYKINVEDQNRPTAGIGLRMRLGRHPMIMDYAVDPMKYLGWIHRVGLSFSVNKSDG